MARAQWPLMQARPVIEVILTFAPSNTKVSRILVADTGAGDAQAPFEMLLDEDDCILCAGKASQSIQLGGAYTGVFPLYMVRVEIPLLGFAHDLPTVGVPTSPVDLDGIACFRFLNRFTYGNFGNAGEFGLEV
jgi:hypothetical protein